MSGWFESGGPVMWPLLGLSLLALTLIVERLLFWARERKRAPGEVLREFLEQRPRTEDEGVVIEMCVVREQQRCERGMTWLDTIITAAPLLGILGTVLGIIQSFDFLSQRAADPLLVSGGVARALITTASGLVISLVVIFPYNFFRARIRDRLDSLEQEGRHLLSRERAATKRFKAS